MPDRPPELHALLGSTDSATRNGAWAAFARRYTPVILSAIRVVGHDRDLVMDAYAFVLEALQADNCRRLAKYRPDGPGIFTTWLTVVVRRLAVDYQRQRLGRPRGDGPTTESTHAARHRLSGWIGSDVRLEDLPAPDPDDGPALEAQERSDAVANALAELEARDRLLVRLRFEDDVPVREIARLMGFASVFQVYRQLDRILPRLRELLIRAGVEHASS